MAAFGTAAKAAMTAIRAARANIDEGDPYAEQEAGNGSIIIIGAAILVFILFFIIVAPAAVFIGALSGQLEADETMYDSLYQFYYYDMDGYYGDAGEAMSDGSYWALLEWAELYLGYPYVWGGSNPGSSFDCSGYICWIFNRSGVANVGRTTAQGLYNLCAPIHSSQARPGDLLFLHDYESTGDFITHVALYVGDNTIIHCTSLSGTGTGSGVLYESLNSAYWQRNHYTFGRL